MAISEAQAAALARGRRMGSSLGGQAAAQKAAPRGCGHCKVMGYTSWMQHLGHLGFQAVMRDNPGALHSIRDKVRKTGRQSSRERIRQLRGGKRT